MSRRTQTFRLAQPHTHPVAVGDPPLPTLAQSLTSMVASGCSSCDLARAQGAGQYATAPPVDEPVDEPEDEAPAPPEDEDAPAPVLAGRTWSGVIGMENTPTGDSRMIEAGALRWEGLPLPLRWAREDIGEHGGAVKVGLIQEVTRSGSEIRASGVWDDTEDGRAAADASAGGMGVSMDLDDVTFEIRLGGELAQSLIDDPMMMMMPELPEPNADGTITVATISPADEVRVTTDGRVRAATLVDIPAFIEAIVTTQVQAPALALVAAGGPIRPPRAWFDNPNLQGPTPMTITPEGRIYGHVAAWDTCHSGYPGKCVSPPRSGSGYRDYLTGGMLTAEGVELSVGRITMDAPHAPLSMNAEQAAAHYDHTGNVAAYVRTGEDRWGLWFAGMLRPGLTDEQVVRLRAAPLSGDWRVRDHGRELMAVLAVNMAGFPVPRPAGRIVNEETVALVAAGMLAPAAYVPNQPGSGITPEDLVILQRVAARYRAEQAQTAYGLAQRAHASKIARDRQKVAAFAARRGGQG